MLNKVHNTMLCCLTADVKKNLEVLSPQQGSLSSSADSESVIDGTSIAIAIVLTFTITATAVAFLSLALGLVLHKRLERKREKKLAADRNWSSNSPDSPQKDRY